MRKPFLVAVKRNFLPLSSVPYRLDSVLKPSLDVVTTKNPDGTGEYIVVSSAYRAILQII